MKEQTITGHTKLTGLLGSPVAHSISPLMHNLAFQLKNLNYVYLCFDVGTKDLKTVTDAFRIMNVRGFNLTMPDKTRMFELADSVSPAAELIGAANTVVQENGKLTAYNTDGTGYMRAVQDAGYNIIGKRMTLLGCGGAATAIAVQAALDGVEQITLVNRQGPSFVRARQLADTLSTRTSCQVSICSLEDSTELKKVLDQSDILTNATPAGMAPHEEQCPLPDSSLLHPELIVSDIIYNPRSTKLMQMAQEVGCPVFNGLYMLLYQGAEAFRLWTGVDMPITDVKNAYFQ
ncbi:MAG: shikimate dehydrogenase [Lachnospiraceae bacterium]|nr:shikimate dehydrogenase [Lachnospiraceae bacterium]